MVPTVKLNNGIMMPVLGFGVFQMRDPEECTRSVTEAIATGYRLIDTAASYLNEAAVGEGIRRSGVSRDQLFITTKLWVQDASHEGAKRAFGNSLKRLGLDYLDLYLIHQPYGDVYGAWRAMEEIYKSGQVKAIGVSNFYTDRITDFVLHNEIVPVVNQIEVHPFHQQFEAQAVNEELGIRTEGWAPFAEGKHDIFQNEVLRGIAARHGRTGAQVILRWLVQRDIVVIPKSVRLDRMQENFAIFDFALTQEDMVAIRALDLNSSSFFNHRDPTWVRSLSTRKLDI